MRIKEISKIELEKIIKESTTFSEVLRKLTLTSKGSGNYRTLQDRLKRDDIDFSHITLGLGHTKGKFLKHSGVILLSDILIENSTYKNVTKLKQRLIRENILEYKCSKCNIGPIWNNEKLTLQLDHINGKRNDNRIENLRIICPNCHTQTETYGSKRGFDKNYKINYSVRNNQYQENNCIDCKKIISIGHVRCNVCSGKFRYKDMILNRPSKETLLEELKKSTLILLGNKYGVSEGSIRKWLK
jgi:Zn finger protein HypA/HybF involved in hydrogenase expression